MIIVNFKAYPLKYFFPVFNAVKKINENYGKKVFLAVPFPFLYLAKENEFIIAQDFFPKEGAYTGKVTLEMLKEFNIKFSLLNHSENQKTFNELILSLKKAKENELKTITCVDNEHSALSLNKLKLTDFIAYEPPELIGGNISVSKAKPDIIKNLTNEIDNLLVGAGIKTKEDVKKSLELGAKGVLVASGVVKAKEPYKILEDWITLF